MIEIDYSVSCAKLYADATFAPIKCRGDFRIVFNIPFSDYEQTIDRLPSWSVDFNSARSAWQEEEDSSTRIHLEERLHLRDSWVVFEYNPLHL